MDERYVSVEIAGEMIAKLEDERDEYKREWEACHTTLLEEMHIKARLTAQIETLTEWIIDCSRRRP